MSLIDRNLVVRIHLDQINFILSKGKVELIDAIYASIALRCLLERSLIGRVAHENGIVLRVKHPDLSRSPHLGALIFVCGGYALGKNYFKPFYFFRIPGENSPWRSHYEEQLTESEKALQLHETKLQHFEAAPSMVVGNEVISRGDVFKFVANKCGGAHHDSDVERYDKIEKLLLTIGEIVSAPSGISAVFAETLGTAWFLLNSPSVRALHYKLKGAESAKIINFSLKEF
jgi:hypothetical protein